jgi:hypothetical protein
MYTLQYIIKLRIENVSNNDLSILSHSLLVVEQLSVWGIISNFDHITTHGHTQNFLHDIDLNVPYDKTVANVFIKSTKLSFLFMNSFTINEFYPMNLKDIMIEDVCFQKTIYAPNVYSLHVENMLMNPEIFSINVFKMPKLRQISLLRCFIREMFVFHSLKSINIQNSILSIDMENLFKKMKKIQSTLFYYNTWPLHFNKNKFIRLLESKHIEMHDCSEW